MNLTTDLKFLQPGGLIIVNSAAWSLLTLRPEHECSLLTASILASHFGFPYTLLPRLGIQGFLSGPLRIESYYSPLYSTCFVHLQAWLSMFSIARQTPHRPQILPGFWSTITSLGCELAHQVPLDSPEGSNLYTEVYLKTLKSWFDPPICY